MAPVAVLDRPALSTLVFVDPQLEGTWRHEVIRAVAPRPLPRATRQLEAEIHGAGRTRDLDSWVHETHTTALLVLDGALGAGSVVHEWYSEGVRPESLLLGASMTKSALAHLVGLAVTDGVLGLEDLVVRHVPELEGSGYSGCTVEHLLTMTSGTRWVEDHRDPTGPASRLLDCFVHRVPEEGEERARLGGSSSRALLAGVESQDAPGTRWEYSTADSQVLDWVRERATGATYAQALGVLWERLGCVRDAVVSVDPDGVALAGGGLAASAEDWVRLAALELDGTAYDERVLSLEWVADSSRPARPFTAPGRLPSPITTHAGFGYHWWPLDDAGRQVTSDGSRGQFGYVDRDLGVAVVKTSTWPFDDVLVDRQQRDLSYLGLPVIAAAAARIPGG